ncbi:Ureidoglycolate lyase [Pseudocyphellaria aurata]|nr:Ureidoglycolate lyase [Pseudocyphellaria aurata]
MPKISLPSPREEGGKKLLRLRPLRQSSFADFGTVIENPSSTLTSIPDVLPDSGKGQSAGGLVVRANQNTALKYVDVTLMVDDYAQSPSRTAGKAVMNMFACFPRLPLIVSGEEDENGTSSPLLPIRVLERHPLTTQTFVPMGLAASDPSTRYLVVVAPTLSPTEDFPDRGPPDLGNIRAFWAHGGQAVTYGSGTWHAPMVVVGASRVDFVVLQFCNGVPEEDCQEVDVQEGVEVAVGLEAVKDLLEQRTNDQSGFQWFCAGFGNFFVDIDIIRGFPYKSSHSCEQPVLRMMYPLRVSIVAFKRFLNHHLLLTIFEF